MKGVRHSLRDFTATAVKEHLRSQIVDTDGGPYVRWPCAVCMLPHNPAPLRRRTRYVDTITTDNEVES